MRSTYAENYRGNHFRMTTGHRLQGRSGTDRRQGPRNTRKLDPGRYNAQSNFVIYKDREHRSQGAGRGRFERTVSSQSGSISGTEESSLSVYSWCGGVSTPVLGPLCTTRPWNITTIASAIAFTVTRS